MAKSYTDLEQSKELSEILPIESADMTYCAITEGMREKMIIKDWQVNIGLDNAIKENLFSFREGYVLPCWSLASLLSILPYKIKLSHDVIDANGNPAYKNECYKFSINRCGLFGDKWNVQYYGKHQRQLGERYKELYIDLFLTENHDNPVDACVAMILKLHELKML